MRRTITAVLAAAFSVLGCSRDISGPVELAPIYELESVGDVRLPVRSFRSVSNAAGSCVYDLVYGVLTFHGTGNYGLSLDYEVRCAGSPVMTRDHDISDGRYRRSGDIIECVPRAWGTFSVERVELHRGTAVLDLRMNAGQRYRLRFAEVESI